jgi:hypothetical protein
LSGFMHERWGNLRVHSGRTALAVKALHAGRVSKHTG